VAELDRYIVGQNDAKRSVAIAIRNRWRRSRLDKEMRREVYPKNIVMIGSTGIGKTEIARRLADLVRAPFIKVEASRFTEVGYHGRDVESLIRDLTDMAVATVRSEHTAAIEKTALANVEERILDTLVKAVLPGEDAEESLMQSMTASEPEGAFEEGDKEWDSAAFDDPDEEEAGEISLLEREQLRMELRRQLEAGDLEDREVEIPVQERPLIMAEVLGPAGVESLGMEFQNLFEKTLPTRTSVKRMALKDARRMLFEEEAEKLIDRDRIVREALERVQESGIVFLDEIDKVAGPRSEHGPDVSREGVQKDLLPIVEGTTVTTRHGMVRTDHILFIAAGAFSAVKPSDLMPELQGRFPIRVELKDLCEADLKRILTEPENALTRQYRALLDTEGVNLEITPDAVDEIASVAYRVNAAGPNIGARRLATVMEKLLEEVSFDAPELEEKHVKVDRTFVREKLKDVVEDEDLSRFIL